VIDEIIGWLATNANPVSAGATAIAAAFAGWGLIYSGMQTAQAARSTDFDSLVHLEQVVRDLESDYQTARFGNDPNAARHAHNQFYNRLEILATGVRYRLLTKQNREYTRVLLIDLIALDEHLGGLEHLGKTRQGRAFEDVAWFAAAHRKKIEQRTREYQAQDLQIKPASKP